MPLSPPPSPTLLDALLQEQGELTAVERFAQAHRHADDAPAQARYYRALIPLGKPRPGEQYAFSVDLDSCTGCKACVSACHSLNGLDDHETWRITGLLHGGSTAAPYQQVVTTACHHCLDPACLNGCPVLAYEKDPLTGIVRHLDDQCIGCQYCVLKCPYDVPQYSQKRGIVRKCDMCHSRLAVDEAPACVQACPSSAIRIRLVTQAEVAAACIAPAQRLLPGTTSSSYTQPTTVYHSARAVPENAEPADAGAVRKEPAHWPLIWMLLWTQLAAGMNIVSSLVAVILPKAFEAHQTSLTLGGWVVLQIGLGSSVFHLGRPLGAWRAFLGWRRSWMSREILLFSGFAAAATAGTVALFLKAAPSLLLELNGLTAFLGAASVLCSAMVYVDTRRALWRATSTFPRFLGTMLLLGTTAVAATLSTPPTSSPGAWVAPHVVGWVSLFLRGVLFLWEGTRLVRALENPEDPEYRSARMSWDRQRPQSLARLLLFLIAAAFGSLAVVTTGPLSAMAAATSFAMTFGSRLIERYLFFVTVVALRMPGGFAG